MDNFLIEPSQLNQALYATRVVVLRAAMQDPFASEDVKQNPQFLPQARNFNLDGQGSDSASPLPHTMPSSGKLSHYLGALGIALTTPVVIYDDRGIFSAPRVWWMLKAMGHESAVVLDGGLPAWKAAGYTLNAEPASAGRNRLYEANQQAGWFVNKDAVFDAISTTTQIVDARSKERFAVHAKEPRAGVVKGHVPGSKNLPFSKLLNNNKFKDLAALSDMFNAADIDLSLPIIVLCGSGVTACIVGMAALMCGAKHVSVYDGSWTEWGSCDECPVETLSD